MQNNLDLSLRQRVLYINVTSCCGNMEVFVLFVCLFVCFFGCGFVFRLFVFVFFSCLVQNTNYVSRYVYKRKVNSVTFNDDSSLCS